MITKNKVNSIWARLPDLRRLLSSSFKKQTAICPFEIVRGSVFEYEDGTEFKLSKKEGETDEEYQTRFKEELGKELDRLSHPDNKKKDKWGREYYEQMHSKYFVKKRQVGRYYAAYFLNDEAKTVIKNWAGNESFTSMGIQKSVTVLILNTTTKEVFPTVTADGFIGNRPFFDRIDKYRRVLWRIPEYDLTYDLENATENEERKRKGFRGSFLAVDRTWFYLNVSSYIRNPQNKQVIGLLATFNSLNDLIGKSGVAINAKIQQGGPGEPFAEPTLKYVTYTDRWGRKKLLGRIPVLDTQFLIPRPVSHATITFHGLAAFNSIAFFGRRAENFTAAREGLEIVSPGSFIFPYQWYKTNWDPLTMKKPPETTFVAGSLHPMIQSYQKINEFMRDVQNP